MVERNLVERNLGPTAQAVKALCGSLGIDASGQVLPARLIDSLIRASAVARKPDFTFCPPRTDSPTRERTYDYLAELRMAAGE